MAKVTLRLAQEGDAGRMAALYAPYVERSTASWEAKAPGGAEMARRLAEHRQAGFPWLVAEEEGALLGYAYAGRFGQRAGYDWDAEATVYLCADARRRRVGKALYTALLALLAKQGYCNCYALVTHPNPASAAFHKALGFRELARLPGAGYTLGQWVDLSYFYRPLIPRPARPQPPVPVQALAPGLVDACLARAAQLVRDGDGAQEPQAKEM